MFFYFFSYFHGSIHCILNQNLLPTGKSFQLYIKCQACYNLCFNKNNVQRPSREVYEILKRWITQTGCLNKTNYMQIQWQCIMVYLMTTCTGSFIICKGQHFSCFILLYKWVINCMIYCDLFLLINQELIIQLLSIMYVNEQYLNDDSGTECPAVIYSVC